MRDASLRGWLLFIWVLGCGSEPPAQNAVAPMPASDLALLSITPDVWPTSGGVTLSIAGQDFAAGTLISVDGVFASTVRVESPTSLSAVLPPAQPGHLGPVDVTVYRGDGRAVSRSDLFSYSASALAFPQVTEITLAGDAIAIAKGDFDGDGVLDLAAARSDDDAVDVLFGDGQGGFRVGKTLTATDPIFLAAADLNRDGFADLAVACQRTGTLAVFLGGAQGNFVALPELKIGAELRRVLTTDLNGDALPDLIVSDWITDNVTALLGNGAGGFTVSATLSFPESPHGMVAADFNRDGKQDLVVTRIAGYETFPGNGLGGFGPSRFTASVSGNGGQRQATVGDFDGNGTLDLFVWNLTSSARVLLGDGRGGFKLLAAFTTADDPRDAVIADFDHDGLPDVAMIHYGDGVLRLYRGDGTGGLNLASGWINGCQAVAMVAADFDRDGLTDLAMVGQRGSITLLHGKGNYFENGRVHFPSLDTTAVATADLNEDGALDLAVIAQSNDRATLFLGDGRGAFVSSGVIAASTDPSAIVVEDMNRDGHADLVITASYSNLVQVHLGDGTGAFPTKTTTYVGFQPNAVLAKDFDRDGIPDLAVSNSGSASITVILNDGSGGAKRLTDVTVPHRPAALAAGDLNGDGVLDLVVGSTSDAFTILLGDTRGNFVGSLFFPTVQGVKGLTLVDLNSDGLQDIVTVGYSNVEIRLGDGKGLFNVSRTISLLPDRDGLAVSVGDFDGDHHPDLAIGTGLRSHLLIWLGDGTGGFRKQLILPTPALPTLAAIADWNGDHMADLVVGSQSGYTLFLNQSR